MKGPQGEAKITSRHLERRAIVYLRQSSERQVHANLESQRLQYALQTRARELGWTQVQVIDTDLGSSASIGASTRAGFQDLIASVALGEVGIVFSREVSRLSRTDKDWCQLQEVCQVFGTLLGDDERVYDLGSIDDLLVLGIKGTMSVVELNVLRLRLLAGMQEKAKRGELIRTLPSGYVRDGTGKVVFDPDERVREAIGLIFRKFREAGSIRQTYLWFHSQGIELPVNKPRGDRVSPVWKLPSHSFITGVLHNPFYAGAYVWGQRPMETKWVEGRLTRRQEGTSRPPQECEVFIRDHHDEYIDWETYEENLRRMRGNNLRDGMDEGVAAVRSGHGLLSGLLRCGHCGRKLHVRYWGRSGTAARYACIGDYDAGGSYCLAFGGSTVDKRFSQEILQVLSPLGMEASLQAIDQLTERDTDREQALRLQLRGLEYQTQRAREQYDAVDPRHRLVAQELERRWEETLAETEVSKARLAEMDRERETVLNEGEREEILALGARFDEVWHAAECPVELKKQIVRTVVEEVIVETDDEEKELTFTIHWKGGTHTRFEMPKPRSGVGRKTSMEDLQVIRQLAIRYGDDEIARVLTKLGRLTATGKRWNESRVRATRKTHQIPGQSRSQPDPEILTLAGAAKYAGVSDTTIRRLVEAGILENQQQVPWAPWEIRKADLDSNPVRGILTELQSTGHLRLDRDRSSAQGALFE
jgi:DNA invertase Pin-like site-specific DNA recombinase